jgi:predicted ATPase
MVETIAGEKELPSVVVEQVALRTDGVPLFVEELTKSVLESRSSTATAVSIPTTLQDSLMARLDRLGPAKDVAQVAAVLGREFSHDLLAEVSTTGDALDGLLAQLVAAELVYERSASPNLSYIFKHALIQEIAYESLLRGTRRALHARIARVLEERFPARAESHPEELARHAEGGGLVEKAIDGYERAGCRANERSASAEAIGHLTRGIGLVRTLPEGPERDARELLLQVALAAPLVTAWGWGSAEVERAYERARELSERVDALPQLFQVVRGMVTFYVARAQLKTARALGERLLRIAESSGDDASQLVANQQMAIILYYQGDSNAALEHYERALTLYDPARHRRLTHVYGEDLGVFIRIWMAWALCLRGFPDQAAARCEEAIALGREADHPFSYAYALLWAAVVHSMRREYRLARERAGAALAIAEEQDFAFVRGGSRLIRAWGRMDPEWERQARDAAIVEYGAALGETAATGSEVCGPQILGSLAEEYQRAGRVQEAAATLEAALATSERTGQPYWDAELLRLKGELVLEGADADPSAAERLFHGALDLSRSQSARWLELRAATSLARLWRGQGKRDPALRLLTSVYEWFEEGFDTCDLREAKALLAVLEQPA